MMEEQHPDIRCIYENSIESSSSSNNEIDDNDEQYVADVYDASSTNDPDDDNNSIFPRRRGTENSTISVIRCLLITTLLTLAAILSTVTFIISLHKEEATFEYKLNALTESLMTNLNDHMDNFYWIAESLSQEATTYTTTMTVAPNDNDYNNNNNNNSVTTTTTSKWPFVSIPDFEQRCADARKLAVASSVWFAPFVLTSERDEWELFAINDNTNNDIIEDEGIIIESSTTYRGQERTIDEGIYKIEQGNPQTDTTSDFFVPIWQISTSSNTDHHHHRDESSSTRMFNQWSETTRQEALSLMIETESTVLSKPLLKSSNDSLHESYVSPTSALYFPIYGNEYDDMNDDDNDDDDTKNENDSSSSSSTNSIRGALTIEFDWASLFQNELHDFEGPVIIVLENTCNQMYSWRINGPIVEYLGEGDHHDISLEGPSTNSSMLLHPHHDHQHRYSDFYSMSPMKDDKDSLNDIDEEIITTTTTTTQNSPTFIQKLSICNYTIHVHPTEEMKNRLLTNKPLYLQGGIAMAFLITCAAFIGYDCLVERRQQRIEHSAQKSKEIVNSLFPSNIRDRLYKDVEEQRKIRGSRPSILSFQTPKLRLKSYLSNPNTDMSQHDGCMTEPIADLFPDSTVLCSDIAGFTAWSSEREPSQVFTLLESVFGALDKAAKKLGVFKVETIGDCYVAATGLPDPQDDHVLRMARFAHTCLQKFKTLVKMLESSLGPGTGDLGMRFGIHSGPVTAGVLRGEKSRFQLFGDTLDTASRMESTSLPNEIHISKDTAQLLLDAGKSTWLVPRRSNSMSLYSGGGGSGGDDNATTTDETSASFSNNDINDGQTFFLRIKMDSFYKRFSSESFGPLTNVSSGDGGSDALNSDDDFDLHLCDEAEWGDADVITSDIENDNTTTNKQIDRVIDWNVDELLILLQRVVARRNAMEETRKSNNSNTTKSSKKTFMNRKSRTDSMDDDIKTLQKHGGNILDEAQEVVELPNFDPTLPGLKKTDIAIELDPKIRSELRDYVSQIAAGYLSNPFHNFDHASHVCMSVNKLLKRIVNSDDVDYRIGSTEFGVDKIININADLHDHTYGISSDPLAHFAIVFSALIHDVGHTGVGNKELCKEHPEIACKYRHQSVAEQRSLDIAWELLMAPCYNNLRECIFPTKDERQRFRQLVVNSVLATDIFDKELGEIRKKRWNKAFAKNNCENSVDTASLSLSSSTTSTSNSNSNSNSNATDSNNKEKVESRSVSMNRKATIVIEHILQASDVSHTMQHWHIYQRWNSRLFTEMFRAYHYGRSEFDPTKNWYKGELWFFDNYVIPLAHKLKDCGVFGVSCDEYLNYAMANREEWERKGQDIVKGMVLQNQKSIIEESVRRGSK